MATVGEFRRFPVASGLDGLRADAGLAKMLGLSRTAVASMLDAGEVHSDGAVLGRSERLVAGNFVELTLPTPPAPLTITPQEVDGLTVIHLDRDLVVVNKPVGVAAHASPGWTGPTVIGGLAAMGITVSTSGAAERQGIVSRLDVGTTGAMVVARSETAYTILKNAFRYRTVQKVYHAIVQGHPDPSAGTIDAPIGRHPKADYKFAVMAGGRESVTHYETLEAFPAATLVKVHLETGRTHQIRVHFSALRHPLLGDLTYGADPVLAARLGLTRQWLHAYSLAFAHPADGQMVEYHSDYPVDLTAALETLREA
ncbi:MAG: RluA family pseudouridine synthase [Nakamurella sp.]